jgi:hypothetical protein
VAVHPGGKTIFLFLLQSEKNSHTLSTRMNGHRSSSTIPTTYPFQLQSIRNLTNSLLIPVGRYVYLSPNTNHITRDHLELTYQFVLSSRHSPAINLR